jgi:hypothetical protein
MEEAGFNWGELLDVVLPIAMTAGAGLLAWGAFKLRAFVASTETKIDDQILAAVEKALEDSKAK